MLKRLAPMKCRVIAIDAMLEDDSYLALMQGSHYALNASHGEGQCLPLMEFMALGKPAVAPHHTGMLDYLEDDNGFPFRSSSEPASWPQDPTNRVRTARQRVDMEALVNAISESYHTARLDWPRYQSLSLKAAEKIRAWAGAGAIEVKLRQLLQTNAPEKA